MKDANVGDKVRWKGKEWVITKILSQEFWDRFGWDIEFIDSNDNYHHWKQHEDGGEFVRVLFPEIRDSLETMVDKVFYEFQEELGIKYGDASPLAVFKLDKNIEALAETIEFILNEQEQQEYDFEFEEEEGEK